MKSRKINLGKLVVILILFLLVLTIIILKKGSIDIENEVSKDNTFADVSAEIIDTKSSSKKCESIEHFRDNNTLIVYDWVDEIQRLERVLSDKDLVMKCYEGDFGYAAVIFVLDNYTVNSDFKFSKAEFSSRELRIYNSELEQIETIDLDTVVPSEFLEGIDWDIDISNNGKWIAISSMTNLIIYDMDAQKVVFRIDDEKSEGIIFSKINIDDNGTRLAYLGVSTNDPEYTGRIGYIDVAKDKNNSFKYENRYVQEIHQNKNYAWTSDLRDGWSNKTSGKVQLIDYDKNILMSLNVTDNESEFTSIDNESGSLLTAKIEGESLKVSVYDVLSNKKKSEKIYVLESSNININDIRFDDTMNVYYILTIDNNGYRSCFEFDI